MKKKWLLGLTMVLGGWTATAQFHPQILQGRNPEFELLAPGSPSGFLLNLHIFPYLIQKGNDSSKIFATNHWYDAAHAIRQISPPNRPSLIPGLIGKEMMENAISQQGPAFLSLVDLEMNYIDTMAAIDGRLNLDSQGRWFPSNWNDTSYYLPFHAQFAGITSFQLRYDYSLNRYSSHIQWVLPDSNIYHRGNGQVERVEINFFDGRGWIGITPNQVLSSDLSQMNHPGYLLIRWGDSTNRVTRKLAFGMNYATFLQMNRYLPHSTIFWNTVQSYHAGKVHSRSGEARMYHFSPTEESVIRKPVVFVEGFDPSPNQEILRYGSIGANLRTGKILPVNYKDTLNTYLQLEGFKKLADSILALGFDLIIVDFKNGADEIEANAQALASCLGYLSALPTRTSELMVIGASMGGLTSRYALRKLENAGVRHCVGTWVSFDSPHLGANIPLNYQALLQYLGLGKYTTMQKFNESLMVPAAMQMLVNHIDSNGTAPQIRHQWNQKQFQTGFPQKTKNVAITNGATNGHLYPLYPNERNFNYDCPFRLKTDLKVNDTTMNRQEVMFAKINRFVAPHFAQSMNRADRQYYEFTPGGLAETGKDLLDGLNEAFGTSVQFERIEYERHSFIPAQSALFEHSVAPATSLLGRTNSVFQEVVHLLDTNEVHVTVNHRTSLPLFRLLHEFLDSFPLQLPNGNGNGFNQLANIRITRDLVIQNGGKLWVNGFQKANYGHQFGPPNILRNVEVSFSNCGHTWIVQSGGQLQIGEQNGTPFPNNAKVTVSAGSILELQSGSVLKVEDYSELVFEKGAMLRIHPGARIELNGPHALLSISSLIRLEDSATFELFGTGKMLYSVDSGVRNAIVAGTQCSWKMDAGVQLEIADDAQLELPANLNLTQFDHAQVFLGRNAALMIQSSCILKDSRFTAAWNGNRTHRGVQISSPTASILHRNIFEYGAVGLVLYQKNANQSAKVLRCQFLNNQLGLEAIGKGTKCFQNTFSNNGIGYHGRDAEMATLLDGNQFQNNQVALDFLGQNTASLYVQGNTFQGNNYQMGVQAQSALSVFSCNRFSGLGNCISQKFGHLELGRQAANIFQGKAAISLQEVQSMNVAGGLNDFSGITDVAFDGILLDSAAFYWIQGNPLLKVDSNLFPSRLLLNPPLVGNAHPLAFWSSSRQQYFPIFSVGSHLGISSNSCRNTSQIAQIERLLDQLGQLTTSTVVYGGKSGSFSHHLMELMLDAAGFSDSSASLQSLQNLLQLLELRPSMNRCDDELAVNLAEKLALNWLAKAFEEQMIQYNRAQMGTTPHPNVDQLVDILDDLKQEKVALAEMEEASAYDLEKAQVFRLAEHYDYAQQLLQQMRSQATSNQIAEAEYWNCVCRAEEQFIHGTMAVTALEDSLVSCRAQLPALRKRSVLFEQSSSKENTLGIRWSQGNLLLSGATLGDPYRIVDVQGKTIRSGVITHSSISDLELPAGMYFFVTPHQNKTLMIP